MTLARWATLARKAVRRPPRYVLSRLAREARQQLDRPLSVIRPRMLSQERLLRMSGERSTDALWTALSRSPFFLRPDDRGAWRAEFLRRYPVEAGNVIARAEAALRHEFDLLGSGPCRFGASLPWHYDFKSGRKWPPHYSPDIDPYGSAAGSDIKVPWELSRCQHFAVLGQAYWLTSDERFADEFVAQTDDWIETNPWLRGVNWMCAMDVALRAMSWIWAFHFFADAPACRSTVFRSRFLRALYFHGEFVARNIEYGEVNGNHYLTDGVGLVFLGDLHSATAAGRAWLETGRRIVLPEILAQTSSDGVDFEQSVPYHRLVLEGFLVAYLLLRIRGEQIPRASWERLERMIEYVAAYTKPDGTVPLHGDADDGRMQRLGTQPLNDHRYLLGVGAVLFNRADFKRAAGAFGDEAFWLLGPSGYESFAALADDPRPPRSAAFPAGGMYVMRDHDAHVFVDCAEVGLAGRGGHGHNDVLSFELFLGGSNLVMDCGAYLYTASSEWRNRFRSTASHNTVQVDDEELNRFLPGDLWRLEYDAVPTDVVWSVVQGESRLLAGHTGYRRLEPPVLHHREFVLRNKPIRLTIVDRITGTGRHKLVSRFHLDPSVMPDLQGKAVRLYVDGFDRWFTLLDAPDGTVLSVENAWVSPSYGRKVPTRCIVLSCTTVLPALLACAFSTEANALHRGEPVIRSGARP